jgi:Signal peptidase, peptidase S26
MYRGTSMYPTLKCGDVLQIEPYKDNAIRKGDVVVFRSPDHDGPVVHRVLGEESGSYTTAGDNNCTVDLLALRPETAIGRVFHVRREGNLKPVRGGSAGIIIGFVMRMRGRSARRLARLAQPGYRRLARSGILRHLVRGRIRFRIASFAKPEGTELQLFVGKYCVGRLPAGQGRWNIRRPFRLIVDEAKLPRKAPDDRDPMRTEDNRHHP